MYENLTGQYEEVDNEEQYEEQSNETYDDSQDFEEDYEYDNEEYDEDLDDEDLDDEDYDDDEDISDEELDRMLDELDAYYDDEDYDDDEEEESTNGLDLSRLNNAKSKLDDLSQYELKEAPKKESKYEYDEDGEVWYDKDTGDIYENKPEEDLGADEKLFNAQKWIIKQTEDEYNREKEYVAYSAEKELTDRFYNRMGDLLDGLNRTQVEVLKNDCCAPIMSQLIYELNNNTMSEETFDDMLEQLDNAVEARMSIYNIRGQQQNYINYEKENDYPLESEEPTGVYGANEVNTWYGKSKKQINDMHQHIAEMMSLKR